MAQGSAQTGIIPDWQLTTYTVQRFSDECLSSAAKHFASSSNLNEHQISSLIQYHAFEHGFISLLLTSSLRTSFQNPHKTSLLLQNILSIPIKRPDCKTLICTLCLIIRYLKGDKPERSCGFAVCREGSNLLNVRPKLRTASEPNKTHCTTVLG